MSLFSSLIALQAKKRNDRKSHSHDNGDDDDDGEQPLGAFCVNKCLRTLRHYCTSQFVKNPLFPSFLHTLKYFCMRLPLLFRHKH